VTGARARRPNAFGLATVQQFLEIPIRRPWLVLIPTVTVLALALLAGFLLPKKYRSSTLILVESERVPDTFVQKISTETAGGRLQTIRQEVLSRTRLERVIAEIDPYPTNGGSREPLSVLVERMRRSINIETKGTDAFHIEFVHNDPQKAMAVANRLATLFIEEAEQQRGEQAEQGFDFITSQLKQTRQDLERKEEAVRRFKEQNLGSLPEQLAANLATLQRLQLEQQTLSESARAAQSRVDLLRQNIQQDSRTARGGASDPSTEDVRLRAQLAELRSRYTDQHPDVQVVLARIRELEARPNADPAPGSQAAGPRAQLRAAEAELEGLLAKRADVDADMARLQGRVDRVPRTEQELATLTRDYGQLQEGYATLLKKQMDAQMAEQLVQRWKGERFKILDPAHLPDEHFFPNRVLFGAVGLVLGLALGVVAALGAEFLDHSVKSPDQLAELVGAPLLALIPQIPRTGKGD
jgi:polysaccharide biosynthesis transport protein